MNLRKVTLRYLGWCPGVDNTARFIPDGDIPDVKMRKIGAILMVALSFLIFKCSVLERNSFIFSMIFLEVCFSNLCRHFDASLESSIS